MQSLKPPHSLLHLSCNIPASLCQQVFLYTSMSLKIVSACISNLRHTAPSKPFFFFFTVALHDLFSHCWKKNLPCHFPPEKLLYLFSVTFILAKTRSSNHYISSVSSGGCNSSHIVCICTGWLEAQLSLQASSTYTTIKSV